jgi:hypothetical protein
MNGRPPAGASYKWSAIILFVGLPWGMVYGVLAAADDLPTELAEKESLFQARPAINTVVIGGSRALRVAEQPFADRGWAFFNMALNGQYPEDEAMELKYALLHRPIRRVALGVSFENMSERYAFEGTFNWKEPQFHQPAILDFANFDPAAMPAEPPSLSRKVGILLKNYVLPIDRARPRFHGLLDRAGIEEIPPLFLPNGNAAYVRIEREIHGGSYDFKANQDPVHYWQMHGEEAYLRNGKLAEHAKVLYRKMFAELRRLKIPTVVFETPRTPEYQAMIEANAQLAALYAEWLTFFRTECHGCVKFVEATAMADCYDYAEFFDPVHYIGQTEQRVGLRLAAELAELERTCGAQSDIRERP